MRKISTKAEKTAYNVLFGNNVSRLKEGPSVKAEGAILNWVERGLMSKGQSSKSYPT